MRQLAACRQTGVKGTDKAVVADENSGFGLKESTFSLTPDSAISVVFLM